MAAFAAYGRAGDDEREAFAAVRAILRGRRFVDGDAVALRPPR